MTAPQNGTARWQLWVSAASVGIVVFGSMVGLYVTATTASAKAMALEIRVGELERQSHDQSASIRVICASLREIETQFKGADQARNIMHANDMRIQGMLWQKAFGSTYPTDNAYYPTIAQDQPAPCG